MSVRVKICARKRIYAAMYVLVSVCTRLRRRAVSISHSEPAQTVMLFFRKEHT